MERGERMRKVLLGIAFLLVLTVSPIQTVQASEYDVEIETCLNKGGMQRADVIVTKYRVNNGVVQYRRWNETRGYWVDPDWINK